MSLQVNPAFQNISPQKKTETPATPDTTSTAKTTKAEKAKEPTAPTSVSTPLVADVSQESLLSKGTNKTQAKDTSPATLLQFQQELLSLPTPTNPADLANTLNNPLYSDKVLGQNRVIALLSVVVNKTTQDSALVDALVKQLIPYASGDQDTLLVSGIINAISDKVEALSRETLQELLNAFPEIATLSDVLVQSAVQNLEAALIQLPEITTINTPSPNAEPIQTLQLRPLATNQATINPLQQSQELAQTREADRVREESRQTAIHKRVLEKSPMMDSNNRDFRATSSPVLSPSASILPADQSTAGPLPENRSEQFAVVTTPSASLPESLLAHPGIRIVDGDMSQYLQGFTDIFHNLREQGFGRVYAILPDAEFWHACHYAKHAAFKQENFIHVIDSKTFGLGLRILIENILNFYTHPTTDIPVESYTLNQLKKVRYWVLPSLGVIKNQFWFKRLQKRTPLKKGANFPLISFHKPIKILTQANSNSDALYSLLSTLHDVINSDTPPTQVIIEHHDRLQEAQSVKEYILSKSPASQITLQKAPQSLVSDFGSHIAVAFLTE